MMLECRSEGGSSSLVNLVLDGGGHHGSVSFVHGASSKKWQTLTNRVCLGSSTERDSVQNPFQALDKVNTGIAQFRDMLTYVGQPVDGPTLREKIRRTRIQIVENCQKASQTILLQTGNNNSKENIPADIIPFVEQLSFCGQLLAREVRKCQSLVENMPLDLSPSRPEKPQKDSRLEESVTIFEINDYINRQELTSIENDTKLIVGMLEDIQELIRKGGIIEEPVENKPMSHEDETVTGAGQWWAHCSASICLSDLLTSLSKLIN